MEPSTVPHAVGSIPSDIAGMVPDIRTARRHLDEFSLDLSDDDSRAAEPFPQDFNNGLNHPRASITPQSDQVSNQHIACSDLSLPHSQGSPLPTGMAHARSDDWPNPGTLTIHGPVPPIQPFFVPGELEGLGMNLSDDEVDIPASLGLAPMTVPQCVGMTGTLGLGHLTLSGGPSIHFAMPTTFNPHVSHSTGGHLG